MAVLRRSSQRMSGSIWPGFVDAMTALLLVLMFVLTIFMVLQSMLRETISGQESELNALTSEVEVLARALGLEQQRGAGLEDQLGSVQATLVQAQDTAEVQTALIASLQAQSTAQQSQLVDFETQVARLLTERDSAISRGDDLSTEIENLEIAQNAALQEQDALKLSLANARTEIDAAAQDARLAAARRDALEALVDQLKAEAITRTDALDEAIAQTQQTTDALSEAEAARLADQAALAALRDRLGNSQDELTAMTLALEEQRKAAEETLTLLAAAEVARAQIEADVDIQVSESQKQAGLLAAAERALFDETERSAQSARQVALLNEQVSALRGQLGALQAILDESKAKDVEANVQLDALTSRLNSALAQVAAEERRRANLERAERERLEAEALKLAETATELTSYQSEFFGRLRDILGDREGVRIVGDRFVFSSEVLFEPGAADLAANGQAQIQSVAQILADISSDIPDGIDWVIRVDGHTDTVPLSGTGQYVDNWELSQARALSVVRFMTEALGFPANRLAAAGFGEYHPIANGNTPEDFAQNRRIELKLTEK